MATLQEILGGIGGGLQAVGSGIRGGGQQFLQGREDRATKLSNERRQALLIDNRSALGLMKQGDIPRATQLLQNRVKDIQSLGGDPTDTQGLLDTIIAGDIQGAISESEILDNAGVIRGFLPKPEAAAETFSPVKDAQGNIVGQQSSTTGKVITDPRTAKSGVAGARLKLDREKFEFEKGKAAEEVVNNPDVQSSKILEDGTIITVMKDGTRLVRNPLGERLEGQEAADSIKKSIRFGTDVQQARAAGRATGTGTVQTSIRQAEKAFERIAPIRKTVQSIDAAIKAIDEGAQTGVIDKLLPSFRESSIKLDTLMNQLGLDVVASTTFGALSAGELSLALDTALPTGLQPAALRKWLVEKKRVQNLLVEGLENAVTSLGEGKTIRDIVIEGREAAKARAATPTGGGTPPPAGGGVLNFDAQGNLIQ